jgi:hypothetical protein
MAYSDFTYLEAKRRFSLNINDDHDLFAASALCSPSPWLVETLEKMLPLAISVSTEKARSEWIIAPILVEVQQQATAPLSLFSGTDFTVETSEGLSGFCDFILTRSEEQIAITSPVLMVVEAKNENMKAGLGQCLASMVAAQRFNEREGTVLETVYGAVTTGTNWRFLKMQGMDVAIDRVEHHVENIERILGIFHEVTS